MTEKSQYQGQQEATMEQVYHNYIGGKWVPARSGKTFDSYNPATGEHIAKCADSAKEDMDDAVDAAQEASERWRALPAPRRGEILYRIAEHLRRDKEELARSLTSEMGKVLVEGRGDIQEAIDMAYYMGGEGRRQFGQIVPSELADKAAYGVREPLGVVGMITPWNFPMAIPSWKSFPALIMGNTIVLKPSPETPVTAALFVKVLEEAGLPPGVMNFVMGSAPELGSTQIGRAHV